MPFCFIICFEHSHFYIEECHFRSCTERAVENRMHISKKQLTAQTITSMRSLPQFCSVTSMKTNTYKLMDKIDIECSKVFSCLPFFLSCCLHGLHLLSISVSQFRLPTSFSSKTIVFICLKLDFWCISCLKLPFTDPKIILCSPCYSYALVWSICTKQAALLTCVVLCSYRQ